MCVSNVCIKIQKFTVKLLFKLHKSMMFAVLEIIRISCSFNNNKLSMTSSLKIYSKFVLSNCNFPGQMQKLAHQKMADLRLLFQAVCSLCQLYIVCIREEIIKTKNMSWLSNTCRENFHSKYDCTIREIVNNSYIITC